MFGGTFGYMDYSISGDKTATVAGSGGATRRSILAQYCSHLWLDPGLNDLNTGATAASVETNLAAMAAAWPGGLGKVIMNTESAWTTSTDGWTTTANQTVASWEAQRVALNAWISALSGYNQIVAPDAYDGNGTNFQYWNNPVVGGSQFTADGVHENHATVVAMASANLFNSSLVHR
jgi:hypothetical protein